MNRLSTLVAIAFAVFGFGCSSLADDAGPGHPTWSLAPEPHLQIGLQAGDATAVFDRIAAVRLLPDGGGVVVADRGFANIRVYGPDGSQRVSMGGPGDGPGEFRGLTAITVLPPDTVLAYDGSQARFTRFLTDGSLITTRTIHPETGSPELYLGRYSDGDVALGWIMRTQRDPARAVSDLMGMGRFGRDGLLVSELGTARGIRRMGSGPVPFSPFLHAVVVRDSLYYTDGADGSVAVVDEHGDSVKSLAVPFEPPDAEAAWSALRSELAAREEEMPWFVSPEAEEEPVPAIGEVLSDQAGRLWVKRYDPRRDSPLVGGWRGARGGSWLVLTSSGEVEAEIRIPDDFIPLDILNDDVAGVWRDDLDVERVAVFELRRE